MDTLDTTPTTAELKAYWARIIDEERAVNIHSSGVYKTVSPVAFSHSKEGNHENIHVHVDVEEASEGGLHTMMRTYNIGVRVVSEGHPGSRSAGAVKWLDRKARKKIAQAKKAAATKARVEKQVGEMRWAYQHRLDLGLARSLWVGHDTTGYYCITPLNVVGMQQLEATTLAEAKVEAVLKFRKELSTLSQEMWAVTR